ncbi:MAG: MutS-related protein [Halanaerobiales bacterium]
MDFIETNIEKKDIMRGKIFFAGFLIVNIILTVTLIYISLNNNVYFLSAIILLLPLYYITYKKYWRYRLTKSIYQLRKSWGKFIKDKRNFKDIRLLFDQTRRRDGAQDGKVKDTEEVNSDFIIDDQTWQDLNMDQIYARIDHTMTTPGENVLYDILRRPLFDRQNIMARNKTILVFQEDQRLREELGLLMMELGKQDDNGLIDILWGNTPLPTPYGVFLNIMAVIPLFLIATIYFWPAISVFLLLLVIIINIGISKLFKKKFFYRLPGNSISYLLKLIKTANKFQEIDDDRIKVYQEELDPCLEKVRGLTQKISNMMPNEVKSDLEYIYQYISYMFLIEARSFNASLFEINRSLKELRNIYMIIGEIDSLYSTASYRESLEYYCIPEFIEDIEYKFLKIRETYHPLLEDPVSNTVEMDNRGIVITGSNMAGKSTFLRTMGINVVLAQTICTCPAKRYQATYFTVISSISRTDNILKGKSFYYAEAERLLKLVNTVRRDIPSLCIIDELLSGTNSLERLYASQEILNYLSMNNVLTIVATHDLELAEKMRKKYKCYHFTDNVTREGLDFDYTLKEGIAVSANAIKLLEYLNYPGEITDKALRGIEEELA